MTAHYVIAEDNKILRKTLVQILKSLDGPFKSVGEAMDGVEAIELVEKHTPDLLILDLQMPRLDGLSVMETIRPKHPDLKILVLTMNQAKGNMEKALQKGANGYCTKISGRNEFLEAVEQVLLGNQFISSDMKNS